MAVVTIVLVQFAIFGTMAGLLAAGRQTPIVWFANLSLVPSGIKWYAPLTYAFLHGNLTHVSVNSLFLWVFGGGVEDALGWRRFVAVYLAGSVLSGLLQAGVELMQGGPSVTVPIVGSSGAVAAIVGVFAVRFYRSRIRFIGLPWRVPAVLLLALGLIAEMSIAMWRLTHPDTESTPFAAHYAHIGGFLFGMIWAQATRMFSAGRTEYLEEDANREMERGSPLAAAVRWEKVVALRPDDLHARAELGRAWATAGDSEQALEAYRGAITGYLRQSNRREAALRYVEMKSLQQPPLLDPADQLAVAAALEEIGQFTESLDALNSVIEANPASPEAEMAMLRSGILLLNRLTRPAEALERLGAFVECYPESSWRPYAEDLLRTARTRSL